MESNANVSLMIMYDDESVEVRYRNEEHLHLSPCGCEFILVKPSGHPLLTKDRVRQRTRFTTSSYKEMIIGALKFRNTYASQPYLPEELIPVDHKKPFFSIDSDVKWPELSSCVGELGCRSETIIRSEEGRAVLTLGPSGEEFSVTYTCSLSSSHGQNHSTQPGNGESESSPAAQQPVDALICQSAAAAAAAAAAEDTDEERLGRRKKKLIQLMSGTVQPKPEAVCQSTTVVQQFSCCCVAPRWRYPLSLVEHLHTTRLSEPDGVTAGESRRLTRVAVRERHSHLPQALPLTCPSPHLHRWRFTDPLVENEHQQLPGDLVKVMWCHGVTYRVLGGVVSVIEASLADGSIIRSNGVLDSYFTHHKPELRSGKLKVKEVTYHLNNLPPDLPGQPYSVHAVVSRASRILSSYSKAKQTKVPATASCLAELEGWQLWKAAGEGGALCPGSAEQHVTGMQTAHVSDLVAAELEKIKQFRRLLNPEDECSSGQMSFSSEEDTADEDTFFNAQRPVLLDNSSLLGREKLEEKCSEEEVTGGTVDEKDIADVLRRTSQAIRDIDAVVSAAMQTSQQS